MALMIRITCPYLDCRAVLHVHVLDRGKSIRCPKCGTRIGIPAPRPPKRSPSMTSKRAFSLIEILIVVVLLGILAAMVVPRFLSAGEQSRETSNEMSPPYRPSYPRACQSRL